MATELISTTDAVAHLRLDAGNTEPDLPQKILSATAAVESLLGFAVLDKSLIVSGTDQPMPGSATAIANIDVAKVRTATAVWRDADGVDQSEAGSRVSAHGANECTFVYPPAGGWSSGLIAAKPYDTHWLLTVGVDDVKGIWREAGLMLLSALYDDRTGDVYKSTYLAASRLLASERRRA